MTSDDNTKGREENDAQPLGSRDGLVSDKDTKRSADREQQSAGPDGGDVTEIGDTFKTQP